MFPLNTNTYPVTRNIRVELAITVIVTVFGVIAQMRLWKVIKERRVKEETSRKEAEKKNEEAEAEVGRQLEEKNLRERTEWENMYGHGAAGKEPSMTETAVAEDSRRGSDGFESTTNDNEKGNSFEMKDMPATEQSAGASDTGKDLDAVEEVETEALEEQQEGHPNQPADQQAQIEAEHDGPPSTRPVTMWPEARVCEDTSSEHGAVVGSELGTPISKRFSGRSLMKRLSWRSANGANGPLSPKLNGQSESEEALVAQDDASSSVLGIVDDLASICNSVVSDCHVETDDKAHEGTGTNNLPVKNVLAEVTQTELNSQAPRGISTEGEGPLVPSLPTANDENGHEPTQHGNDFQIHQDDETEEYDTTVANTQEDSQAQDTQCFTLHVQPNSQETPSNHETAPVNPPEQEHEEQNDQDNQAPDAEQAETEADEDPRQPDAEPAERELDSVSQAKPLRKSKSARLDASTVKEVPEQTSMVVNSFRTNEWAKHLADAELPEIEPIQLDYENPESSTETEEVAAPVNVQGLLQTPLNGQPPPVVNSPEQTIASPEKTRRRSYGSTAPYAGLPKSKTKNNIYSMSGARSPPPMSRNISSASLIPLQQKDHQPVPIRSTSTPFLTITTPAQHQEKDTPDSPRWSGPPPLLAVREDMVRNRMSSTSLRYDPFASRSQSHLSLADPALIASPPLSIPEERDENVGTDIAEDADNVPLSKRRAMLQRQTVQSPSSSSLQSIEPARPVPQDSPRSTAVMAAWRQSVREEISQRRDPLSQPFSPGTPASSERPRWGSVQQMRDASATTVENTIADRMQRGSMTDLHRQAMRRMQASANRKL